jgi:hypothetical protein
MLLGSRLPLRRLGVATTTTGTVTNASTTVIVDPIDVIIVIAGPTAAMTTGIDVIISVTTPQRQT